MRFKNILVCFATYIFLVCSYLLSHAQEASKIIPPSPEAASLGKFADIPVGTYSGVPNITIPLYQIKTRDISLPIGLSYHASGIKVEEEASWVGLGWTLNAGGAITRMTRGRDDFLNETNYKGYLNSSASPTSNPANQYMEDICIRKNDGEPDIFYFNFAGTSGKFYLERKINSTDPVKVRLLSPEKIRVLYDETLGSWTIWDKNGYKYIFQTKEYTQVWNQSASTRELAATNLAPGIEPTQQKIISAWYLNKIISPLGEEVNFEYTLTHPLNSRKLVSRSVVDISEETSQCIGLAHLASLNANGCPLLKSDGSSFNAGFGGSYGLIQMAPGYNNTFTSFDFTCLYNQATAWQYNYQTQYGGNTGSACRATKAFHGSMRVVENAYLKRVVFEGGNIVFNISDRLDMQENIDPDHLILYGKPQKLDEIVISNNTKSVKKISFGFNYWDVLSLQNADPYLNKRLRLDQVSETNGTQSIPPHRFSYETAASLPLKNSFSRDHWGFNNGASNDQAGLAGQPTLIPKVKYVKQTGELDVIPGANREANESMAPAAVLKIITYPTGGRTTFSYESNTFNTDQTVSNSPIKSFDVSVNSMDVNKRSTVFDLKEPNSLTFVSEFKCLGLACYPSGVAPNPSIDCFGVIRSADSDYYLSVTRLSDGVVVWSGKNYDFYCVPGSTSNCQLDPYGSVVTTSGCGLQKSKTISLLAGKYMIKTSAPIGFVVTASTSYAQSEQVSSYSTNLIVKGGGLRIKSIIHHDGLSVTKDRVTRYNYHFNDAAKVLRSSGKLMTSPKYGYAEFYATAELAGGYTLLTRIINNSYSNLPLGSSAQGGFVGYDKVEEISGAKGENGKTVPYFMNRQDEEPVPFLPNSPAITHSPSNGLLTMQEVFDANGFKVKQIINSFANQSVPNVLGGISLMNYGGCTITEVPEFIFGKFVYKYYSEPSEWWYQIKSIENTFDQADPTNTQFLTKVTDSFYDNPNHKQITRMVTTTSKGETSTTYLYYPLDVPTIAPPQMWDETNANYKHIHGTLIKQETFLGALRTSGSINNYTYNSAANLVLQATVEQALQNGNYEIRMLFQTYDATGNVLQLKRSDNTPIAYLWGYNKKLPIAQITNATYAQVVAALNPADLTLLEGNTLTPQQIRDKLNVLRTSLTASQITIFTYDLLVGVVSVTDPNNQSTFYEYDDLSRLSLIKDFEQQPISGYKYGYKN